MQDSPLPKEMSNVDKINLMQMEILTIEKEIQELEELQEVRNGAKMNFNRNEMKIESSDYGLDDIPLDTNVSAIRKISDVNVPTNGGFSVYSESTVKDGDRTTMFTTPNTIEEVDEGDEKMVELYKSDIGNETGGNLYSKINSDVEFICDSRNMVDVFSEGESEVDILKGANACEVVDVNKPHGVKN